MYFRIGKRCVCKKEVKKKINNDWKHMRVERVFTKVSPSLNRKLSIIIIAV